MDGTANSVVTATSVAMRTSLLAGLFSVWLAMRVRKDPVVSILFGIATLLIILNGSAATLIAVSGMAYVGLLQATFLLTAAFAVVGMVFGLMRSLRSGRALKTHSA